jgi:hypothetical protein
LKKSLEEQKDELQSGYMKLIQEQVQSLTRLIQSQTNTFSFAQNEGNRCFIDLALFISLSHIFI